MRVGSCCAGYTVTLHIRWVTLPRFKATPSCGLTDERVFETPGVEDGMSFGISGLMVIYGFVYYLYKQSALRVVGFHYQRGNFKL